MDSDEREMRNENDDNIEDTNIKKKVANVTVFPSRRVLGRDVLSEDLVQHSTFGPLPVPIRFVFLSLFLFHPNPPSLSSTTHPPRAHCFSPFRCLP